MTRRGPGVEPGPHGRSGQDDDTEDSTDPLAPEPIPPPPDLERAVLNAAIWCDPDGTIARRLDPGWFLDPRCAAVATAITTLVAADAGVDITSVHQLLRESGHHVSDSDAANLVFAGPRDGNGMMILAPFWCDELDARAERRRLRSQLLQALEQLEDDVSAALVARRLAQVVTP